MLIRILHHPSIPCHCPLPQNFDLIFVSHRDSIGHRSSLYKLLAALYLSNDLRLNSEQYLQMKENTKNKKQNPRIE